LTISTRTYNRNRSKCHDFRSTPDHQRRQRPPQHRPELQAEIRPQGALQQILFDELAASAESYLDLKLDRLARHKTRIERSFHRSLRELKALQTDAALTLPLAARVQIAKRTQALALGDRKNGVEDFWSGADAEAAAVLSALENHARPKTLAAGAVTV
jgi:hypothetical protein